MTIQNYKRLTVQDNYRGIEIIADDEIAITQQSRRKN